MLMSYTYSSNSFWHIKGNIKQVVSSHVQWSLCWTVCSPQCDATMHPLTLLPLLYGNEIADHLVKEGSKLPQEDSSTAAFNSKDYFYQLSRQEQVLIWRYCQNINLWVTNRQPDCILPRKLRLFQIDTWSIGVIMSVKRFELSWKSAI